MELRHLRYFVVAAEEEHFHRAAERLRIVQPALSRQIRMLEDEIGVSLFERLSHGVRLSPAGRVFLEGATKILEEVEWLTARAKRAEQGQIGLLAIGFNSVGGRNPVLPEAINAFRRDFPQVELRLSVGMSLAQVDAVKSGKLDLVFVIDPPSDDPELDTLFIQHYNCSLVLPAGHALAAASSIRLADLRREPFILVPRTQHNPTRDRLEAACVAGGLHPNVAQVADDEYTILQLIAVGLGLSFLVSPVQGPLPQGVVVRPVEDLTVPMDLRLVWRRDNAGGAVANFAQTVRAALEMERRTEDAGGASDGETVSS